MPYATGAREGPFGNQANDPLNLPQFSGPYAAPLTNSQQDAMRGFEQLAGQQPQLGLMDLLGSIQSATAGPGMVPTLSNFGGTKGMLEGLTQGGASFDAPRFDLTEMFKQGENVFQSDLERQLAGIREEYSGLGLGPGSSDRATGLGRAAGDSLARFRLGQQGVAQDSFENAEQRRLQGLGLGNQFLGTSMALEGMPFQEMLSLATQVFEPAKQREMQGLGAQFALEGLPFERMMQQFGLGESARQVGETEIDRRMGEFARTQGGGLNQILALLNSIAPMETIAGPSGMSQLAEVFKGIGEIVPDSVF